MRTLCYPLRKPQRTVRLLVFDETPSLVAEFQGSGAVLHTEGVGGPAVSVGRATAVCAHMRRIPAHGVWSIGADLDH